MVKPGTTITCRVSYKPNGIKLYEEEQVDLRVEDGQSEYLNVSGTAVETKCETQPAQLNFGSLADSESVDMFLSINNVHAKSSAIFMIDPDTVPSCIKISKLKGKIYP